MMAETSREMEKGAAAGEEIVGDGIVEMIPESSADYSYMEGLLKRFLVVFWRIKDPFGEKNALEASNNFVLVWARGGSPFRILLLIAAGMIVLLALTGLLFFIVFFLVASLNAIIVAFLVSLAAAGGILAIFFAFLAAIYIGAMSTAVVVISTITICAVIAVCIASGWVCFFWITWLAASKSMDLTKKSLKIAGLTISA